MKSPPVPPGSIEALRRQAWARMLGRVFEVDPLLCPPCQTARMEVVDRILRHRRERGLESVFETPTARAPPAA